jgi:hypothetical protein
VHCWFMVSIRGAILWIFWKDQWEKADHSW